MRSTVPSRFAAALRAKYRSPRDALRALGLDENLVTPGEGEGQRAGGLTNKHAIRVMDALKGKISADDMALLADLLKNLMHESKIANADAEQRGDLAGDDEKMEKFCALLKESGLSDADIEKACDLAMPQNALTDKNGRLGMDGASALDQIRGSAAPWAVAIRREDLGTLGSAAERLGRRFVATR